jgi:hypothetical protein
MTPQVKERDNFLWLLWALVLLLFLDSIVSQFQSEQGRLLVNISLLFTLFLSLQPCWRQLNSVRSLQSG